MSRLDLFFVAVAAVLFVASGQTLNSTLTAAGLVAAGVARVRALIEG